MESRKERKKERKKEQVVVSVMNERERENPQGLVVILI